MTSITFIFRTSTRLGAHCGSLVIRLIHERKIKTITTNYRIYPNEWNTKENRLVIPPGSPRIRYLHEIAEKMAQDISLLNKIIETYRKQGIYSVSDIATSFRYHDSKNMLSAYVAKLVLDMTLIGMERTARAYLTTSRKLITYNKGKDIRLEHINMRLLKGFENDMMLKNKSPNTISFYMRNLRAIYNKAVEDKLIIDINENPFRHVYTGIQVTRKRALSIKELTQLYDLDIFDNKKNRILNEELHTALQIFFFCFHARGMSFVDMAYLRKDNIRNGIIRYFRKKTSQLIEVKITPAMQKILDYFSPQVRDSEYLFPVIKNNGKPIRTQYESGLRLQNKRLKKLSSIAMLQTPVSTHVARHSWATVAKHENLPIWVISEGLGHSNEKTTYTYLASFERSVLDKANERISTVFHNRSHHRKNPDNK